MSTISPKKIFAVRLAGIMLALFLFAGGTMAPLFLALQDIKGKLSEAQSRTVMLEKRASVAFAAERELEGLAPRLGKLTDHLLDLRDAKSFIAFQGLLAETSAAPGLVVATKMGALEQQSKALLVQAEVRGSFPQFLVYLQKLEYFPYLTAFRGLSFTRLSDAVLSASDRSAGLSEGAIQTTVNFSVFVK